MAVLRGFAIVAFVAVAFILLEVKAQEDFEVVTLGPTVIDPVDEDCVKRLNLSMVDYLLWINRMPEKNECMGICHYLAVFGDDPKQVENLNKQKEFYECNF